MDNLIFGDLIGSREFGQVYKAQVKDMFQFCCVTIIDFVKAGKAGLDPNCELEKLRSLKYSRIVQYFSHGFHRNKLHFAMEFIEGMNLFEFLEVNQTFFVKNLLRKYLLSRFSSSLLS
jgi:serine/threonine protein kinase